ncbi:precorrin-6y C5,15-methyltransferase (decarboxylating) subunit CbiE [Rhodopirellula sp. MGV]|uniref:precorrin-6y C5,15-methyltransferase (decarboxylating) subunit CbiE n=1 Tax=Rhodopirellula sp. MGV TaxID=2023130 RepID=UPI000B9759A9|nr:precorrin-6y C5,15-methyltransferase (decarboxylating) subunit CbiE [Rhodopirellula sp. MGV]OYP35014.1 cobalamin biosynthesis bifunctional protein CbiET [Rhodopirellula sp. MGV]PNY38087.1 precorrin-6y C5,15-methyltransferase (decarboxylating) subunit CbiE [Rhodopirellula baltica]
MTARIHIVGIGDDGLDGLTGHAKSLLTSAEMVIGTSALLNRLNDSVPAVRVECNGGLDELKSAIAELPDKQTVLLASGDPLFYGIANYLTETVGKDRFEIVPHVSSMQLAFARVKESWDDAYLSNLAVQPLDRVVDMIRSAERVGLFTTDSITPSVVAEALLDRRIDYFNAYVCENLGTPRETVTRGDLQSIRGQSFSPLNVMVLVRRTGAADLPSTGKRTRLFGNPDDVFLQSRPKRGLLTPMEVRCIALAELELQRDSIVWDVGAGSGALAIEAASIATAGKVFAIEMDAEDYNLMLQNAERFDVPSLVPIHGQAPAAWASLPDPSAVFVGGSGRIVPELVREAASRMPKGRIVVSVSSPDNLLAVQKVLEDSGYRAEVRMINIARGQHQLDRVRFESLNPMFLIVGGK